MTAALVKFLRARYDEREQIAREASRDGEHGTATGEHWQWVESEYDLLVPPDPVTEEYVGENAGAVRVALRSVEEYPTRSLPNTTLPHFVVPYAAEVPAVCGLHIADNDPAYVLADLDSKRRILDLHALVWRDIGWLETDEDGSRDEAYAELEVCGHCVPKHSHYPTRADVPTGPCLTVRLLALPYAEHPDYQERWRP